MHRILIPLGIAVCTLVLSGCAGAPQNAPTTEAPADPVAEQRETLAAYVDSVNAWDRDDESTLDRTLALVTDDWAQFETGEFHAPSNTGGKLWSIGSADPVDGYANEPALGLCLDTGDHRPRPLVAFFVADDDAPHGWRLAMLMPADGLVHCDSGG